MVVDWVLMVGMLLGGTYVLLNARRLASRPRRGTEARPSQRWWVVVGALMLLGAFGGFLSIVTD